MSWQRKYVPPWRNWYTQQVEGLCPYGRARSSRAGGTHFWPYLLIQLQNVRVVIGMTQATVPLWSSIADKSLFIAF